MSAVSIRVEEREAAMPTNDAPGTMRFTTRVLGVSADFVIQLDGGPRVFIEWREWHEFCFAKRGVYLSQLHEEVVRMFNQSAWIVRAMENAKSIRNIEEAEHAR